MDEGDQAGKSAKGRARQTVSDKRQLSGPSAKRKKTNMNIRTAILYRKNFATLVEESVSGSFVIQFRHACLRRRVRDSQIFPPRYQLTLPSPPPHQKSLHDLCVPSVGTGETTNVKNVPCHIAVLIAVVFTMKRDVNDASFERDLQYLFVSF